MNTIFINHLNKLKIISNSSVVDVKNIIKKSFYTKSLNTRDFVCWLIIFVIGYVYNTAKKQICIAIKSILE